MKMHAQPMTGLFVLEPTVHGDDRGYFFESWNCGALKSAGISAEFVQENESLSAAGTLRGLHYQLPNPQGKLVRVIEGRIWDVAVDLRQSSPTFGQWFGVELSRTNRLMLWVPDGFAHGFLSMEDDTRVLYSCTAQYDPATEHVLAWDDSALAIEWPLHELSGGPLPIISVKDAAGLRLTEVPQFS